MRARVRGVGRVRESLTGGSQNYSHCDPSEAAYYAEDSLSLLS